MRLSLLLLFYTFHSPQIPSTGWDGVR